MEDQCYINNAKEKEKKNLSRDLHITCFHGFCKLCLQSIQILFLQERTDQRTGEDAGSKGHQISESQGCKCCFCKVVMVYLLSNTFAVD